MLIGQSDLAIFFDTEFQIFAAWKLKKFECAGRIKVLEVYLSDSVNCEYMALGLLYLRILVTSFGYFIWLLHCKFHVLKI